MKLFNIALSMLVTAILTSCSGSGKKVFVMATGKITVDANDEKNIKIESGTTHTEKEIILSGGDKETLTVQSAGGNKTFEVSKTGYYLLNLKPDTLVGGIVKYGTGARTSNLTGEDVDHIIDSTQKLILGQNASDESKTYFVLPYTLKEVSKNLESKIVGPYNGIPGSLATGDSGKMPEVYKFYTNKQQRESVEHLVQERKK